MKGAVQCCHGNPTKVRLPERGTDVAIANRVNDQERNPADVAQALLLQRNDGIRKGQHVRALRSQIAAYEAAFGIPSAQVHAAIENGTLTETKDVCSWIMAYDVLQRTGSV